MRASGASDAQAYKMTPAITIFVRHTPTCKYAADEFSRRCQCRKHFRWSQNGTQHRRKAGTRAWAEAEELKRKLEDQFAGRTVEEKPVTVFDAAELFLQSKRVEGVGVDAIEKYTRDTKRLQAYCDRDGVVAAAGLTVELLTKYMASWEKLYPSSTTRSKTRERLSTFLRFCCDAGWLRRVPRLPKIKVEEIPTLPLTTEEYARLLDALYVAKPLDKHGKPSENGLTARQRDRVRASIQLMRWSGLAIRDALTLPKAGLIKSGEVYRVETAREKTGTHVSVVIPTAVAEEILAAAAGEGTFIFWSGEGNAGNYSGKWTERYIRPAFDAAGIQCDGHMVSHRLRDTFAVHLLEKGVPLEDVSKALGHRSIKTTEKYYAKWVQARQTRLDNLIAGTW